MSTRVIIALAKNEGSWHNVKCLCRKTKIRKPSMNRILSELCIQGKIEEYVDSEELKMYSLHGRSNA